MDGITSSMDMSLSKLGDSEGQGSLTCCSPWSGKDLDVTELLKKTTNAREKDKSEANKKVAKHRKLFLQLVF